MPVVAGVFMLGAELDDGTDGRILADEWKEGGGDVGTPEP